jgi:hypothetical protein
MWLIHNHTGEEGWHICQENQREPCDLAVFVKDGGAWKMKLWPSRQTSIRAKNYNQQVQDASNMIFPLKH